MQQNVETTVAPIRHAVTVDCPPARAFEIFTAGMGGWWPKEFSISGSPMKDVIVEPRAGGRYYELGENGVESPWGEVLAWEPSARVALAWRINEAFAYVPTLLTEVDVRFAGTSDGCRVEFEHRGLERLGEAAEAARAQLDGGWGQLLSLYKAKADASRG